MSRTDIKSSTSYDQYWDEFDNIYIDFALEYTQQLLTLHISLVAFSEFPSNFPPGLIIPILAHQYKIYDDECRRRGLEPEPEMAMLVGMDETLRQLASQPLDAFQTKISQIFISLHALSRWGKKLDYREFPDFERILITQHVITVCSFAEGFYSNVVRYLATRPPYPFNTWKRLQRGQRRTTSMTNTELLDKYIFEQGQGDFNKKLRILQQTHNISLSITSAQNDDLKDLFLVRNHLVHNAGRVGKFFMDNNTRWSTLNHSDLVPLETNEIESLIDTLIDIVVEIYRSCSLQLLGKTTTQLVWGSHRM